MVIDLFAIFIAITLLFFLFLLIKALIKVEFCVLCVSVSFSWIILLIMFWLDLLKNPLLISVLLGTSVTGVYYLFEKKVNEKFHVFRLPFFLTLVFVAYLLLGSFFDYRILFFLLVLWLIFSLIYFWRNSSRMKGLVKRLIECCKNW